MRESDLSVRLTAAIYLSTHLRPIARIFRPSYLSKSIAIVAVTLGAQAEVLVILGQYKEQFAGPDTYRKKAEEEGSENFPKAAIHKPHNEMGAKFDKF